jgi:hypothetical protein
VHYRQPAALLALILVAVPVAVAEPVPVHTRLAGQFAMTGHITAARGVPGEHVGEAVTRTWSFVAPCPAGQCSSEQLMRMRATGVDVVILRRDHGMFGHWIGRGSFLAPLKCAGRVDPTGERVFFTVAVRITAVQIVAGAPLASAIFARYSSYKRTNRTRCVSALGRDAAVYTGALAGSPPY